MGPKKGRNAVRRIAVPTEIHTEFELVDTVSELQCRREEREAKETEEEVQKQMDEARR